MQAIRRYVAEKLFSTCSYELEEGPGSMIAQVDQDPSDFVWVVTIYHGQVTKRRLHIMFLP